MLPVGADRPQQLPVYASPGAPLPCCVSIGRVGEAASAVFRAIREWLAKAFVALKDRVIDWLPEPIALRCDPRRIFIRAIFQVDPDHRAAVFGLAIPRISLPRDAQAREQLLNSASCARSLLRWVTPEMYASESLAILAAIALIPAEEREAVVGYSDRLMEGCLEGRANILGVIAQIPVRQRGEIIAASLSLIKAHLMNVSERIIILSRVAAVAEGDRGEVMGYVHGLITDSMDASSRGALVEAVAATTAAEREVVIANAYSFFTDSMNGESRKAIIEAVAVIPAPKRAAALALAHQFMPGVTDNWTRKSIIGAMAAGADRLITAQMDGEAIRALCRAVAAIPAEGRESAIRHALPIIAENMPFGERISLLREVAAIPAGEREEVVRNTLRWIVQSMNVWDRIYVIHVITRTRAGERDAVTGFALQMVPQGWIVASMFVSTLVEAVAALPAAERGEVVRDVLRLITPGVSYGDRVSMMRVVAALPLAERADIIRHARKLFTRQLYVHSRARILQEVAGVAANLRVRYIRERRRGHQLDERAAMAQGINVHAGDRDERLRDAIALLYRRQGPLSEARISQAVREFTHYIDHCRTSAKQRGLARRALLDPKGRGEVFGPLIDEEGFTVLGFALTGKEFIARLWIFASTLKGPEEINAKDSMVSGLADSYYETIRVCNQGKAQRLVIGVLQGRLAGIDIELRADMQVPTPQAMEMFFNVAAHRDIDALEPLLRAANQFCTVNPAVNRDDFIREMRTFAEAQGLAG